MFTWVYTKVFGKEENSTEKNLQQINDTAELLRKQEERLTKKLETEEELLKLYLKKGNKIQAKNCLLKKKQYEQEIQKLAGKISNVETASLKVERGVLDMETLKVQQIASSTIKDIYKKTEIGIVEENLENIKETLNQSDEISKALSESITGDVVNETELEEELLALENEISCVTTVPDSKIQKEIKQVVPEDIALSELEKELNGEISVETNSKSRKRTVPDDFENSKSQKKKILPNECMTE
eukprot:gene8316-140_t